MTEPIAKVHESAGPSRSKGLKQKVGVLPPFTGDLTGQLMQSRAIIESLPVGIAIFSIDMTVEWVNPFLAAMFGYEPAQMMGRRVVDLWPNAGELLPVYQLVLQGEAFDFPEFVRPHGDGERCFDVHLRPIMDDAGVVSGIIVIADEISDRKRAEDELREQTTRLQATVTNVPAGVGIFNPDMTINWVNELMAAMYGMEPEEIIGKLAYDIQPVMIERQQYHKRVMEGESFDFDNLILHHPDGQRHFDSHYRPMRDETGAVTGMIVIANEITERKHAELALEQRSHDLERSNADLEQFAYVASHDLQEPLRSIIGFTSLLERRYRDQLDDTATEYIARSVNAGKRMQQLVSDLLTYSRVGQDITQLTPTDCQAIIESEIENMHLTIQELGAEITHDDLPIVAGDPSLLGHLFRNLLSNAIKFRSAEPPRVHVGCEQNDTGWLFSVRDNGIGIDPQYTQRIFTIFQRLHTREEYPGTGIGLSLCKKAVDRLGGDIWLDSEPGQGSTFYFTVQA